MGGGCTQRHTLLCRSLDRRSSIFRLESAALLRADLPLLRDTPLARREALFRQKLQLCCVMDFNWDAAEADAQVGSGRGGGG